jgi:hypothetical protein
MTGYSTGDSDFSELVNRYNSAAAALGGTQHNWAIEQLNALKDEFALCEGDPQHGKQATHYKNEIVNKLSE